MIVLIAKQNEDFFKSFDDKLKFTVSTKNTSTFTISSTKFEELKDWVKSQGYNPFSVMAWK